MSSQDILKKHWPLKREICLQINNAGFFQNMPPRWMQQNGLEWVYRLASDLCRLWRHYLKHTPRFDKQLQRTNLRRK
ncbi:MAG: WecB/TagA/CpsF family glycosyltransferase [Desulfobulbaceae bacterium]|jgi:hypothetical protein|nr:WecB/TagA/CpsF family glycosyltransferase [Desulfobulbaceae bacterium]